MTEEVVKTSRDDGFKNQWATGFFYRMDGKKWTIRSKALLGFLAGFFMFCMVAVLFSDSGNVDDPHVDPITVDSAQQTERTYNFAELDTNESERRNDTLPAKTKVSKRVERFVGLQRLDRLDAIKIPPGTMVQAHLTSGASNGPVRAKLKESVRVDGDTAIPTGTLLVGTGTSTEERLFVRFGQAVLSNGKAVKIAAQACDSSDQTVGLKGSKVGNEALKLASGIGLNFVGGVSEGLQESEVQGGVEVKKPTMKNALLNGASTASLEYARQTMSELKSKQPVIEVPNGTEICILFQGGEDG